MPTFGNEVPWPKSVPLLAGQPVEQFESNNPVGITVARPRPLRRHGLGEVRAADNDDECFVAQNGTRLMRSHSSSVAISQTGVSSSATMRSTDMRFVTLLPCAFRNRSANSLASYKRFERGRTMAGADLRLFQQIHFAQNADQFERRRPQAAR
jgi:hypothetical protein